MSWLKTNPAKLFGACLLSLALLAVAFHYRQVYLQRLVGEPHQIDLGGDPAHHFSIAKNIYEGRGPRTDFIFAYWFRHPTLPALSDVYPPGYGYLCALAFGLAGGASPFAARLVSFVMGLLTLLIVGALGYRLRGFWTGWGAALLVAVNLAHIEHSTVIMTSVTETAWLCASVFFILRALENRRGWALAGLCTGCATLTRGLGPALVASLGVILATEIYRRRATLRLVLRESGYALGLFLLFYFLPQIPWFIETWRYFGKPLYSNANFYPFAKHWVQMQYEESPPHLANIFHGDHLQFMLRAYGEFLRNLRDTLWQVSFPVVPDPYIRLWKIVLSFGATVGLVATWRNLSARILPLTLGFLFLLMFLAAPALGGAVYPRYVLPFITLGAVLALYGWSVVVVTLRQYGGTRSRPLVRFLQLGLFLLGGTAVYYCGPLLMQIETTFWNRSAPGLVAASAWLREHSNPQDAILFGQTPQDLAYLAQRSVVVDPNWAGGPRHRAAEEIRFYKVRYVVVDQSTTLYDRSAGGGGYHGASELPKFYPGVDLHLVYTAPRDAVYVYRVKTEYP